MTSPRSSRAPLLFFAIFIAFISFPIFAAQAQKQPISLGGIFDLTSQAGSIWGNDERDGFILAIEDFRKANPQFEVSYAVEDSAYSNTLSLSALQKLVGVNKVKFVVGPTWETFVAVSPICERSKVICFAPSNHGGIFHDPKNPLRYSFTAFF